MTSNLLCGHWTFHGPKGKERTARCDLPHGHEGTVHKFWTNPEAGESFSWDERIERHQLRDGTQAVEA